MSNITYNNFLILSGQPTPLVARTPTPFFRGDGRRLGIADNYTLNGVLTGCQFSDIVGQMAILNNIFSKDFGTLNFLDDDGFSVIHSGAKINQISYEQGIEVGIQPYVVDITVYPENFFENAGVIDKRNDWSATEEANKNLTISHDIFAKGVNTAPSFNNALTNAKNFVLNFTGFTPPTLFPFFISGFSGSLDTRKETINRLEGTYQISETYVGRTGSAISEEITINLDSGNDGIISVDVQGTYRAGKSSDFSTLRQKYSGLNSYALATGVYVDYRGITGLQPIPLSSGITENYQENSLNFNIQFNDWPEVAYRHVYDVQVSSGVNGIITASINGNIEGIGRLPERYDRAYRFFTGLYIFGLVNPEYQAYVGPSYPYPLRETPISSGNTDNRFAGSINYQASFDNRTLPLNCSGIKFFDVTISKTPAIRAMAPISIPHSVSGIDVADLGYKSRAIISVQGNVVVSKPLTSVDATGVVARYVNGLFSSQFLASGNKTDTRLDSVNISQDILQDSASFTVQYSCDESLAYVNYNFITGWNI